MGVGGRGARDNQIDLGRGGAVVVFFTTDVLRGEKIAVGLWVVVGPTVQRIRKCGSFS